MQCVYMYIIVYICKILQAIVLPIGRQRPLKLSTCVSWIT